ncbi:helix-turn-helix domain-containing protein [Paenibacillus sp. 481]|uniref:helix-turn-helix domain-containing protein n=1 Tax=Paenibacillus sp. 481 TaxID=2835869 RepID=UPI001E2893E7|nr:helix-turn-helix transcriptional regulator [Paenibacillus sp. 481]UHA73772.1 helix-turn-helix transcriptional regulator [Paenibacillus sp. 481]
MARNTTPLGELIQQYRGKSGMTLAQLKSKISITKGTLSKIENGETKKPEFKTVQSISSVLNIPFHEYVEKYIELEQKSESLMGILEIAIAALENTIVIPKIATKLLESEKEDSLELVKQCLKTTLYTSFLHKSKNYFSKQ